MKRVKRYTAIQIGTTQVDQYINVMLTYGQIQGPYYDQTIPSEIFETEEEAMEYAERFDHYATWLIIPVISFKYE